MCQELGATIGFDAVAGEMSATVLQAQLRGSRLLVYGALSLTACQTDPASLIFEDKHLEGFYVMRWLRRKNILAQLRPANQVQELLGTDLKTEIRARLPLEDAARALETYSANMTAGKILLMP